MPPDARVFRLPTAERSALAEYLRNVSALTEMGLKPGEISDPVKTDHGYRIIQVQSRSVRNLADLK